MYDFKNVMTYNSYSFKEEIYRAPYTRLEFVWHHTISQHRIYLSVKNAPLKSSREAIDVSKSTISRMKKKLVFKGLYERCINMLNCFPSIPVLQFHKSFPSN